MTSKHREDAEKENLMKEVINQFEIKKKKAS